MVTTPQVTVTPMGGAVLELRCGDAVKQLTVQAINEESLEAEIVGMLDDAGAKEFAAAYDNVNEWYAAQAA